MKIWIKLCAGLIIGVLLGLFIPDESGKIASVFSVIAEIIISIGRYTLFPLVFFSMAYSAYELRMEKKLLSILIRTLIYMAVAAAVAVIIGTAVVLVFSPQRIPIIIESLEILPLPNIREVFLALFPTNLFKVFVFDGNYLLPLAFFAVFLGITFSFDKLITRPVTQIFDSLAQIFFQMSSFILEVLSLAGIILAADLTFKIGSSPELSLFTQLIIILLAGALITALGIYPLLLYLFGGRKNPFPYLYGQIAPALAGLISGDTYFSTTMLIRHGKENLGIPRRVGATTFPLFALFGKAGTALVTAASFLVIINSYSSLGITVSQVLWVLLYSFLFSFLTGPFPGLGVVVSLSALCGIYGKGLEDGFLILKPIFPLLISFSVFLDMVTAALVSLLVAKHEKLLKETSPTEMI